MIAFLNTLTLSRVERVFPQTSPRFIHHESSTVETLITKQIFDHLLAGIKERHCTVEADSFMGEARCTGGRRSAPIGARNRDLHLRFDSSGFCRLSDALDALEPTKTTTLPREPRSAEQLVEWDDAHIYEQHQTHLSGDLIVGVVEWTDLRKDGRSAGRFVKWFLASEQFLRFYYIITRGPTSYNLLDTLERVLSGNSRLVVDTRRKMVVAGLSAPPYNHLRCEEVAQRYMHVYVVAIVETAFGKTMDECAPRVRGVEIAWDVPR